MICEKCGERLVGAQRFFKTYDISKESQSLLNASDDGMDYAHVNINTVILIKYCIGCNEAKIIDILEPKIKA